MKYFYSIVFLLSSWYNNAQETSLSGIIVADSIETTQINIVNFTQKIGVVNDTKGFFEIKAHVGDSILFSSVQYQPYHLIVTQALLENKRNKIYLFPEVNELEEVKISDLKLTGDLKKDIAGIEILPYRGAGKKPLTEEEHVLSRLKTPGALGKLADVISGRHKIYKRMEVIFEFEAKLNKIRIALPHSFYVEQLGIPKEYIEDFLYFCAKDTNFNAVVKKNNPLEYIAFLKAKPEEYRKFKAWED